MAIMLYPGRKDEHREEYDRPDGGSRQCQSLKY